MFKFLAPKSPLRTSRQCLNNIGLDGGKSRIIFNNLVTLNQESSYLVTNHLPPAPLAPLTPDSPNSSLCPPFHIHLREHETFHVISGEAKFLFLGQPFHHNPRQEVNDQDVVKRCMVRSGEEFTIPRGQIHTFRNASRAQPLVLEFGFSPSRYGSSIDDPNQKMKRFFLNTQLYRSDCTTQRVQRSLIQVLLFNYYADVVLVPSWVLKVHKHYPLLRGPIEGYFAPLIGRLMNFWGGIILGKWVMGLKETYEEYSLPTRSAYASNEVSTRHQNSTFSSKQGQALDTESSTSTTMEERASANPEQQNTAPKWVCQAWKHHSFDGQDDEWRR